MKSHWSRKLRAIGACDDAVEWARTQPSLAAAWRTCPRGDWMLWLLGRLAGFPESEARKPLVLCACAVARTALQYVPAGEKRPLRCIETAERWARGDATIEEVREARRAADAAYAAAAAAYAAAAAAAYAAAAASADEAAAYAAAAAAAYAAAAASADEAAAAAAAAAYAADADAAAGRGARAASLARAADIVREHYPRAPRLPARKEQR